MFQHTAARRRLRTLTSKSKTVKGVSTHSRPKAAVQLLRAFKTRRTSFNTQPPEGGCNRFVFFKITNCCFNTQPPEGGCLVMVTQDNNYNLVSTHSRPKAAASYLDGIDTPYIVSTHSRPKAAAIIGYATLGGRLVSTHSRPKAAAKN